MSTDQQKELYLAVSQGYCLSCGGPATDFHDAESRLLFAETGICQDCQDTDAEYEEEVCPDCECEECECREEESEEEDD